MKKKTNLFYSFLIAITAVLGMAFLPSPTSFASADSNIQVQYTTIAGYLDTGFTEVMDTDANGKLTSIATASRYPNYYLKGWVIKDTTELITTETVFTEPLTQLVPVLVAKTFVYTITQNPDTTLSVVGATAEEGLTYPLTTTAASMSDVHIAINADNQSASPVVPSTLNFDDYVLADGEQITLSKPLPLIISGNITSANEAAIFKITASAATEITFLNLTLTNNSYGTFVDIPSTANIKLNLDSVSFNTTVQNSAAIAVTPTTTISLAGAMSTTTTSLYNYVEGSTLDLTSNTLSTTNPINIAVDYTHDKLVIATDVYDLNYDHVGFVAKKDFYVAHKSFSNNRLIVRTSLNMQYDVNGGQFVQDYTIPNIYYGEDYEAINLPTASNIYKDYATFDGWFGQITITAEQQTEHSLLATTYFFDVHAIDTFIEAGATIADFDTYFKTSLDDFDIESSITAYIYSDPATDYNRWANFYISQEARPTLIAKWNAILYTITFNSNGGSAVDSYVKPQGEAITKPEPTKTGYTFVNWYTDEELTSAYTFGTMPAENFTLYAAYQINSYTITFKHNNGESDSSITQEYATEIEFPELVLEGHTFAGWFVDAQLQTAFDQTTVPAANTELFAGWTRNYYFITLSAERVMLPQVKTLFGEVPTAPADPTADGYVFHGWFTDITFTTPFDFSQPTPAHHRTAYAKWTVIAYTLTLVYNNGVANHTTSKDFGSSITIPAQPTRAGYNFAGWYTSSALTERFEFTNAKMPARNVTLYASWTEKIEIAITLDKQSIEIDSRGVYQVQSLLSGFTVYYLVDGEWQTETPTKIGSYDVKVVRAEDAQYKKYESQVLEDGFTVTQKTLDLSWLPVTMLIVFVIEICMVIVVKLLRKKKLTNTIVVQSIALPFGIVPKTQFILSVVTIALALFGFIYLIVELVKLHKTVPLKDEVNTKYDNRALLEKRGDKSEDSSISSNVSDLLKKEGLYSYDYSKDDNYKIDEDIIGRADDSYTGKKPLVDEFNEEDEAEDETNKE